MYNAMKLFTVIVFPIVSRNLYKVIIFIKSFFINSPELEWTESFDPWLDSSDIVIDQCGLSYWLFFGYFKQLQSYGRDRCPNISHTCINIQQSDRVCC